LKMTDFLRTLHFRAERLKGYVVGVCLMITDEVISPLTAGKQYQLPYALSAYIRPVFVPDQYVWEATFAIISIIFLFT
jgi:hypothetical protein